MIKNMTTGSPTKVLILFALPLLIGNIIQQLNISINAMIVGQYVGVYELAAIGASQGLNFLFMSAIFGLAGGVSIIISQYFGAGNDEEVKKGISTGLIMIMLASCIMAVLGIVFAEHILTLLRTPEAILPHATLFITTTFLGLIPLGLFNGVASMLRAFGNAIAPLVILVATALLNIVFNYVFIVGFNGGIRGAALATVTSQFISAIAIAIYAYRQVPYLRIKIKELKIYPSLLKQMLKMGLPSSVMISFLSIGNMLVQVLINGFGTTVVAGSTAAMSICFLAYQPALAIGNATSTFTGQNIGAGKVERVKEGFWVCVKIIGVASLLMTFVVQIFQRELLEIFIDSGQTEAVVAGQSYLRIIASFYVVFGIQFVLRETIRGTGDAMAPMIMGMFDLIVRVGIAFAFSQVFGYVGLWWGTPTGWLVAGILGAYRYRTGEWRNRAKMIQDSTEEKIAVSA